MQGTGKQFLKVYVWGSFCKGDFRALYVFTANMTAAGMVKIYKRYLFIAKCCETLWVKSRIWQLQEDIAVDNVEPDALIMTLKDWIGRHSLQLHKYVYTRNIITNSYREPLSMFLMEKVC